MFDSLTGQDHIKKQLEFYLQAYKSTNIVPALMFNGAKGLGKTEFAKQFAKKLKKPLLEINCSTIKSSQQFFEQIFIPVVMDNEVTILFDEAHALPKDLVMAFLTVFNVENAKRKTIEWRESTFEFNFEKQTFIFATTELDKLFVPFRDRLTVIDFKPYSDDELATILKNKIDWVTFTDNILPKIASTLRGNARSAVKRAVEINLYCESRNTSKFGEKQWKELCDILGINPAGFSNIELEILNILKDRGDCTLAMLSAATGLSRTAIQRDAEVYLLRKGVMKIEGTRRITPLGLNALKQSVC